MIDLFAIASKDQSVAYLAQMFGMVGNLLPTHSLGILGVVFKLLNTLALTLGALLVVYITVVGLLSTAHEGEFMGKKWSGLWVPIRTVLGIAALFPTPTGYSAIQVVFMWVILQGIGAADTFWTTILKYSKSEQSVYSTTTAPSSATSTQSNIKLLFQGLVCQATAKRNQSPIKKTPKYFCNDNPNDAFCIASKSDMLSILSGPQVVGNVYRMGPVTENMGACGNLVYCNQNILCAGTNSNSTACKTCIAQREVLASIVLNLGEVAETFTDIDVQYARFFREAMAPDEIPTWIRNMCIAKSYSLDPNPTEKVKYCCGSEGPNKYADCAFKRMLPNDKRDNKSATPEVINLYKTFGLDVAYPGINFIKAATEAYDNALLIAVKTAQQNRIQAVSFSTEDWQKEAQDAGWILAGGYYYKLSSVTKQVMASESPTFQVDVKIPGPTNDTNPLNAYRNNYSAAARVASGQAKSITEAGGASPDELTTTQDAIKDVGRSILVDFMTHMSADDASGGLMNPLVNMAKFGNSLIKKSIDLYTATAATIFGLTSLASVNPMALGTGLTMGPVGEGLKAMWGFVGPAWLAYIGALLSLGGMLAIYIPLIPFVIFSMGALGWMMTTVEALVAAPLVALGILSPGGQHELLGKAEPALMLLLNLFLRPSLMVLGLVAAMVLSIPAVTMVNVGFSKFMAYNQADLVAEYGLVETIFFVAAYTTLMITLMNKIFTVIYVIPERILTWIGGQAVSYGEQEALGQVKHGVEGAASATAGAAKAATESVHQGTMGVKQSLQEKPPEAPSAEKKP